MAENLPLPSGDQKPAVPEVKAGQQPVKPEAFKLPSKEPETPQKSAFSFLKNLMQKESPKPAQEQEKQKEQAAPATSGNGAGGNVFTQLFGKKTSVETPTIGAPIAPIEAASTPKAPPVTALPALGPKAVLLKRRADELREQKRVRSLKMFLTLLLILAVSIIGYFTMQLQPEFTIFGRTLAKEFTENTEKIKALQTQADEFRLRIIALNLTRVNLLADSFLEDSAIAASPKKTAAEKLAIEARVGENRENIKQSLKVISEMLQAPLSVELPGVLIQDSDGLEEQFENQLIANLEEKKKTVVASKEQDVAELRTLDNLIHLIGNHSFRAELKNIKGDLDDAALRKLLYRIRDQWTDEISIISQLKSKRIKWTEMMDRIDALTRKVDKIYNQGLFESIGGIQYSSYEFNADAGTISLSGLVKTEDTRTFTMMVNLVDIFEKSPFFKDVEMRDFSKSKTSETGSFSGSINLILKLQGSDEKDPRDSESSELSLTEKP